MAGAICSGCSAEILWVKTEKGRPMPCDPKLLTVVTEDGRTVKGYTPHWATCPKRQAFRPGGELR